MRPPPARYLVILGALALLGIFLTLTFLGVPPFDNLALFIFANVAGFFTLLILGVVGGAFVGMLLAHRMLATRQFTPFERSVLEGIEDVRGRLDALEKRLEDERR